MYDIKSRSNFLNMESLFMEPVDKKTAFSERGQQIADKAAGKIQGGLDAVKSAADTLGSKVEAARVGTGPTIDQVSKQATGLANDGIAAVKGVGQRVRARASDTTDSVVAFTRDKPVTALLLAGAAGALLITLLRALSPPRD